MSADHTTHLGLARREAETGGTGDQHTIGTPAGGKHAQAVGIMQGMAQLQRGSLGGRHRHQWIAATINQHRTGAECIRRLDHEHLLAAHRSALPI